MEQSVPWLTLKSVPGVGNLLFNRLIREIGSPQMVLEASAKRLSRIPGMTPRLVNAVTRHARPDWVRGEIRRCADNGYRIITQQDPSYPALLLQTPDPPPVLYCYGTLAGADCHIAMVGSRKATAYGKTSARNLAKELATKGISVVSGMALGIDTAAHLGALEAGGRTVAVLGSGLACVYPPENLKLYHRIAENGAVISEFSLDARPESNHFPRRNRIISGMALGTVVVEAARRSGSLITARLAAEQGREVFAVPGSIHAVTTRGTHDLIKQGAKLVESAEDIVEEIAVHMSDANLQAPTHVDDPPDSMQPGAFGLNNEEIALMEAMGPYPVHIDELARRCNQDVGRLNAALLQLEIKGLVGQEPGKLFHIKLLENVNRAK